MPVVSGFITTGFNNRGWHRPRARRPWESGKPNWETRSNARVDVSPKQQLFSAVTGGPDSRLYFAADLSDCPSLVILWFDLKVHTTDSRNRWYQLLPIANHQRVGADYADLKSVDKLPKTLIVDVFKMQTSTRSVSTERETIVFWLIELIDRQLKLVILLQIAGVFFFQSRVLWCSNAWWLSD